VAPPSNPASSKCTTQTFPAPAYTGAAAAAPIVGVVGYSLNGMNMCVVFARFFGVGAALL
jgi:hypothetical protein